MIYRNIDFRLPAPVAPLLKSIRAEHANALCEKGEIRLFKVEYYREIEDRAIRDENDGIGILNCRGQTLRVRGLFPSFIWCMSQAQISIPDLAKKFGRDSVLLIHNSEEFARRLITAAYEVGSQWSLECCSVAYDKGSFRDREVEADDFSEHPEFYIFQKDKRFSDEVEFRFALTDINWCSYESDFIDLRLHPCGDIAEVKNTGLDEFESVYSVCSVVKK